VEARLQEEGNSLLASIDESVYEMILGSTEGMIFLATKNQTTHFWTVIFETQKQINHSSILQDPQ
jgi:hypothetical protein